MTAQEKEKSRSGATEPAQENVSALETESQAPAEVKNSAVFIHSALDEFGLTPAQFRVFCHVARRGACYESAKRMAPICRMHRDTVWDALNFLVEHQLLSRTKRTGQTTVFSVAPIHKWRDAHPAENKGQPSDSVKGQRRIRANHPAENKGHKVYPLKVYPKKKAVALATGSHKRFFDLWADAYKTYWGTDYMMQDGKDGKAIKQLLESTGKTPEELIELARQGWARQDEFDGQQSMTIAGFASRYNQIAARSSRPATATGAKQGRPDHSRGFAL